MNKEETTEQQILAAAREVFIQKGLDGARMQQIADKAGINKALLHYYFRSKEQLFIAIFHEIAAKVFSNVQQIVQGDIPLKVKITLFVQSYLRVLAENPYIPGFVISSLHAHPEYFMEAAKSTGLNPLVLQEQFDREAAEGNMRSMKVEHVIVNIVSLCVFPYLGRHAICGMLRMDEERFASFMDERKDEITKFVLQSIFLR